MMLIIDLIFDQDPVHKAIITPVRFGVRDVLEEIYTPDDNSSPLVICSVESR